MGLLDSVLEYLNSGATVATRLKALDAKNKGTDTGLLGSYANPDAVMGSDAANFASGLLGPMGAVGMGGVMTYHGTPHTVQRYDLSKVGSGQGAQSYGHGIYFAENPAVGQSYHEMLAGPELKTPTGETIAANGNYGGTTQDHAAQYVYMQQKIGAKDPIAEAQRYVFKDMQDGLRKGMNDPSYVESRQAIVDQLQAWKDAGVKPTKSGGVYKQDLPDEMLPKMLQWDKPLSEQPEGVQKAANAVLAKNLKTRDIGSGLTDVYLYPNGGGSIGAFTKEKLPEVLANPAKFMPFKGEDFYNTIAGPSVDRSALAQQFTQMGIPGVSYLDAGSRAGGKGTMNHVVWDQGLLDRMIPQVVE